MKFFGHDTDAFFDKNMRKVVKIFGAPAYAVYWYCLENVGRQIDPDNLTFELDADSEIIALDLQLDSRDVDRILQAFVGLGMFECEGEVLTVKKMARRIQLHQFGYKKREEVKQKLDEIKAILDGKNIDRTCTEHVSYMECHDKGKEIKGNEIKDNKDLFVEEKSPTKKKPKFTFSEEHMKFAKYMHQKILEVMPRAKEPNFEKWAHEIRLAANALDVSLTDLWNVFIWANADGFWKTNILSPSKLRDKFPQLEVKKNEASKSNGGQSTPSATQPPLTEGQRLRIQLNQERAARGEPPIDWSRQ